MLLLERLGMRDSAEVHHDGPVSQRRRNVIRSKQGVLDHISVRQAEEQHLGTRNLLGIRGGDEPRRHKPFDALRINIECHYVFGVGRTWSAIQWPISPSPMNAMCRIVM